MTLTFKPIPVDAVVAPVGGQPAAVLAPLRTLIDELGATVVVLVHTAQTTDAAQMIASHLTIPPLMLEADRIDRLPELLGGQKRRCLLINGGQWPTVTACAAAAFDGGRALYATSRDHMLYVVDEGVSGLWQRRVGDVAPDVLLELNDVRHSADWTSLFKPAAPTDSLGNIVEIRASAGFLYAAVDASGWQKNYTYRLNVLRRSWLQSLGLDSRRLLLIGLPEKFKRRAEEDGVPYAQDGYSLREWRAEVDNGEVADRPERQVGQPFVHPTAVQRPAQAGWSGAPMLAVMGTNPGTTLRVIWAARPRRVLLLYDARHPVVRRVARLLCDEPELGCSIEPLAMADPDEPTRPLRPDQLSRIVAERLGGDAVLAGQPGDKLTKLLLSRLGLPPTSAENGAPPPLAPWVRLHASRPEQLKALVLSGTDREAARAVLHDLAGLRDDERNHLNDLTRRRTHPFVAHRQLHTSRTTFILGPAEFVCSDAIELWRSGRWYENVCAAAIAEVMDEVLADITHHEPGNDTRDQLDIVARCGRIYSHWSCKTSGTNLLFTRLREARGQADRLLGTGAVAVLATARRPGTAPQEQKHERIGHVVDARLLADPDALHRFVRDVQR